MSSSSISAFSDTTETTSDTSIALSPSGSIGTGAAASPTSAFSGTIGTVTDASPTSAFSGTTGTVTDASPTSASSGTAGTVTDASPTSASSGTAGAGTAASATSAFSGTIGTGTAASPTSASSGTIGTGTAASSTSVPSGTGGTASTTSTLIPTTTTTRSIAAGSRFTVEYLISQSVNPAKFNFSSEEDIKQFFKQLSSNLTDCFRNISYDPVTCCGDLSNIIYSGIPAVDGTLSYGSIEGCIISGTESYASNTNLRNSRKMNCTGSEILTSKGKCRYCVNEPRCADFPESTCVRDLSTLEDHCECDRTKYFFRTNYEYNEKCYRFATVWWPQMLALCLLVFAILILLCACLMCLRRRHIICKRSVGKTEVIGNAPNKNRDFEYIGLNNMDQSAANYTARPTNNDLASSVYPTEISNDYPYQRRTPQSSRHLPLIQIDQNPTVYNEIDDRESVIRDMYF
ncbi:unnamed protein product [Rotaria socialis]